MNLELFRKRCEEKITLRSKQAYLSFLGFPKHSKLDVFVVDDVAQKTRSIHVDNMKVPGSTEIVVPTTSKSIFTGFGLAVAMVLGLKTLSLALDNPAFSLEGMLDSMVDDLNETEESQKTPMRSIINFVSSPPATPLLTSTTSGLRVEKSTGSLQNNIDELVQNLVEIEPEP